MGTMTVTGCLSAADGNTGAAQGSAPATPAATTPGAVMPGARYMLKDVSMDGQMRGGTSPTPGTPAPGAVTAAPAHAMPTQFMVVGASGVDLGAHVGHKVSITGTVAGAHSEMRDKPMAKADMPAMRPGDAPRPGTMGMDHMGADKGPMTLTASSITMVSATCTATR